MGMILKGSLFITFGIVAKILKILRLNKCTSPVPISNYFRICPRKLWLFHNVIQLEHTSDLVYEGKLIHENSYPFRSDRFREVEIGGIKIDFYDHRNRIVHEIKKSDKREDAHIWQLKYYLYVLEQCGVENPSGILEYPKMRKTEEVTLSDADREETGENLTIIEKICTDEMCPEMLPFGSCRSCSYFEYDIRSCRSGLGSL
jgi:CRISPR-associated exonuclease Cas4